jgi:hypothetical protein
VLRTTGVVVSDVARLRFAAVKGVTISRAPRRFWSMTCRMSVLLVCCHVGSQRTLRRFFALARMSSARISVTLDCSVFKT